MTDVLGREEVEGGGVGDAMCNNELRDFLRARATTARYVTSVCSGTLVLAAAGLLAGHRAASHWATREVLVAFGVEVSTERVCVDRDRITGVGITAGIGFGLTVVAEVLGRDTAGSSSWGWSTTRSLPSTPVHRRRPAST